jgi:DNA-directed RNA polymerase subunit RPC12/RpoP
MSPEAHAGIMFIYFMLMILFLVKIVGRMSRLELTIARLNVLMDKATRCPVCGHPVLGAPFCDGDPYHCPDCGTSFEWEFDEGLYRLRPAK